MRIHSFASIVGFPFALAFAIIMYYMFTTEDHDLSFWLIPSIIILAIIWIFSPQINYWWWKRNPPPLDPPILKWLQTYSPFYNSLSDESQRNFERRMSLFILGKEFGSMGEEKRELPEDLKGIIANNAIQLTFGRPDFLFDKFDRIVVYKHPFPTPSKQYLHTVETETEDGTLIFSMEHLVPGMLRKGEFYNIGLHGFIDAFLHENQKINYPNIDHITWQQLEKISGFSIENILATTGLKEVNKLTVAINHYVTFFDHFSKELPKETQHLNEIFKLYSTVSSSVLTNISSA